MYNVYIYEIIIIYKSKVMRSATEFDFNLIQSDTHTRTQKHLNSQTCLFTHTHVLVYIDLQIDFMFDFFRTKEINLAMSIWFLSTLSSLLLFYTALPFRSHDK